MAVELKVKEVVTVTQTLAIEHEITDDDKRPLGLACHEVAEGFEWDPENPGHATLQRLLKDVKNALGVRVSKKKEDEKPKKTRKPRKPAETKSEASPPAASNGDTAPGGSPPPDKAPVEEASSTGGVDAGAAPGSGDPLHNPFAVPPGSQK